MSAFEEYIKSKKPDLDSDEFSIEIWDRIERELPRKKKSRVLTLWLASAAAAVIVFAIVLSDFQNSETISPTEFLSKKGIISEQYKTELSEKTKLIKSLEVPVDQKSDFEMILTQLKTLDQEYIEHLKYIEQYGYQEAIGERILEYYKTKIMMLDKIQQQIKEINYYEEKYNKQSETEPLFL